MEIENLSKEEIHLKAEIARYQQRLNLTPVREQQLAGILRDYNLLKQNYADLLGKQQQSQLAMSLEKQQEGQHFRLVDPPSLPMLPSSPKRLKVSLGGAAAGMFLGLALAFLLDARDHSLKTEKEVGQHFAVPLVLGIPLVQTPSEERQRTWTRVFECVAGSVLVLAVAAAELYVYWHR
jgi:capsular polysaccharide biosynthesis protein